MSHNTFGHLFRVTTWGESHGPGIGCVVDGCPPGIPLRGSGPPGLSRQAPARPVALHDPAAGAGRGPHPLGRLDGRERPAGDDRHADRAADRERRPALQGLRRDQGQVSAPAMPTSPTDQKYGIRDYRGGGRSSARETAMRVAAGGVARKVLRGRDDPRRARADGPARDRPRRWDWDEVDDNPFFCPDAGWCEPGPSFLDDAARPAPRSAPSSRSWPKACPRVSGAPIYGKLDADLASRDDEHQRRQGRRDRRRLRRAAELTGEENADEMRMGNDGKPLFLSNHAGGILGGISTGQHDRRAASP